LILLLAFNSTAKAQEITFSQQYTLAQFLNPASVGSEFSTSRFSSAMRTQSIDGNKLNATYFGGFDVNYHQFAYGVNMISDQIMSGAIQYNTFNFNMANKVFLDASEEKSLAIGLGATYTDVSLDKTKLIFADQFDYRAKIVGGSSEYFNLSPSKFSSDVGFVYKKHTSNQFLEYGGAATFYTKALISVVTYNESNDIRLTGHLNYEREIAPGMTFAFHVSNLRKNSHNITLVGGAIGLPFFYEYENERRLYVGMYYRLKDAYIPTIQLVNDSYSFGVSYDVYNNDLTQANLKPSSFELTFRKFFSRKEKEKLSSIFN
jgi:hypothetical protein